MAGKEIKPFCPINEYGEIVTRCASADDLEGFVRWMYSRESAFQHARERAYRRLSAGNTRSDLINAKSRFLAEVAGEYLGACLNERTSCAESGSDNDKKSLERTRRWLTSLLRVLEQELFVRSFHDRAISDEDFEALEQDLKMGGRMFAEMGELLTKKTGEQLVSSCRTFMKMEECGAFVNGGSLRGQVDVSAFGYYAPLINYLATELSPAQRVELLGGLFAYIDSGWALADMSSSSESALELTNVVEAIERDPGGAGGVNVADVLGRRLGELIKPLNPSQPMVHPDGTPLTPVEMQKAARLQMSQSEPINSEQFLAPMPYRVAALVSPSGKRVVLYILSGEVQSKKQQDEWEMRWAAVQNSARDPEFLKLIAAEPGASVEIKALMPGLNGKKGRRHPVSKIFELPLNSKDEEAVLTMMFASRYLSNEVKDKFFRLGEIDPIPLGGSMDTWTEKMAAANLCPTREEREAAIKVALCEAVDRLLSCVTQCSLKPITSMQKLDGEGRAFLLAMKTTLVQVFSIKEEGAPAVGDALAAVAKNPGWWHLFSMLDQSTEDSVVEIKKELETEFNGLVARFLC